MLEIEVFLVRNLNFTVRVFTWGLPFDETHLDAVRGLIELRGFYPSASTSTAR